MTALLPLTCSDNCRAHSSCHSPARFQARLDVARHAQHPPIHGRTEACAGHLSDMVQAIREWAQQQGLTEGDLTILTIDPSPNDNRLGRRSHRGRTRISGLIFSVIPLGL